MAQIFDLINDIALSYDGDLLISENNDLKIVSSIDWFKREVNKIVRTNLRDWKSEPDIGVDLDEFIGKLNNKETASEIKNKLLEALHIDNFQFPGEFDIKVIPTSTFELSIYISYNVVGEHYSIGKLIYNLDKGISKAIFDELDNKTEYTKPQNKKNIKNKYLNALKNR